MDIPTSRQLPAPSPQPPPETPAPRPPRQRLERAEDESTGRLGAAAGEEIRHDDDPTAHYATD
jgi:hypothetical protein